jgi:hypothetical protein
MPTTHKLIQTITVSTSTQAAIEFTSIPQTYTDLVLMISCRTDQAATISNLLFQFNGDTASNYYSRVLWGNGASVTADYADPAGYVYAGPAFSGSVSSSNLFGSATVYIPNYTGSASKTSNIEGVTEDNATTRYVTFSTGRWSGTSAITSIKIYSGGSANLVQYSSASLYGIKNS